MRSGKRKKGKFPSSSKPFAKLVGLLLKDGHTWASCMWREVGVADYSGSRSSRKHIQPCVAPARRGERMAWAAQPEEGGWGGWQRAVGAGLEQCRMHICCPAGHSVWSSAVGWCHAERREEKIFQIKKRNEVDKQSNRETLLSMTFIVVCNVSC